MKHLRLTQRAPPNQTTGNVSDIPAGSKSDAQRRMFLTAATYVRVAALRDCYLLVAKRT